MEKQEWNIDTESLLNDTHLQVDKTLDLLIDLVKQEGLLMDAYAISDEKIEDRIRYLVTKLYRETSLEENIEIKFDLKD